MKTKLLPAILVLLALGTAAHAETGFQAGVTLDFLNYENAFIAPAFSVQPVIAKDMELDLGMAFGIYVLEGHPRFKVPLKVGFNFLFTVAPAISPILSIGVLPQIVWGETTFYQPTLFLIGPYIGGGIRFQLHPLMSWFVDVQQTLLIGAPKWINTGTRIGTGMQFRLDAAAPASAKE